MNTQLIDSSALGVEVSWSFGDGNAEAVELDREEVIALFDLNGFDVSEQLEMTEDDAIRRAHRYTSQGKNIAIKEMARPNKDTPRAYGVYKRIAIEGESGDDWQCHARVRVHGNAIVCLDPEDVTYPIDPEIKAIGDKMADLANKCLTRIMNVDLSNALTAVGSGLGWISRRRNSGGVYFILQDSHNTAGRFVSLLQELAACTEGEKRARQFIPQIQEVYPKPLTMASWKGSAIDSFEAEIATLRAKVATMLKDGKMRSKTMEKHADECDRLMGLAERYQVLVQDQLGPIVDDLAKLRAQFYEAIRSDLKGVAAAFDKFDRTVGA